MVDEIFQSHLLGGVTVDKKLHKAVLDYSLAHLGVFLTSTCGFATDTNGGAQAWVAAANKTGEQIATNLDKESGQPATQPKKDDRTDKPAVGSSKKDTVKDAD